MSNKAGLICCSILTSRAPHGRFFSLSLSLLCFAFLRERAIDDAMLLPVYVSLLLLLRVVVVVVFLSSKIPNVSNSSRRAPFDKPSALRLCRHWLRPSQLKNFPSLSRFRPDSCPSSAAFRPTFESPSYKTETKTLTWVRLAYFDADGSDFRHRLISSRSRINGLTWPRDGPKLMYRTVLHHQVNSNVFSVGSVVE